MSSDTVPHDPRHAHTYTNEHIHEHTVRAVRAMQAAVPGFVLKATGS